RLYMKLPDWRGVWASAGECTFLVGVFSYTLLCSSKTFSTVSHAPVSLLAFDIPACAREYSGLPKTQPASWLTGWTHEAGLRSRPHENSRNRFAVRPLLPGCGTEDTPEISAAAALVAANCRARAVAGEAARD